MQNIHNTLISGSLLGICFLGYYACRLWEKSIQLQKQKLYANTAIQMLEIGVNYLAR